jgi:thiol-disulfide isomerase/thioredoxin
MAKPPAKPAASRRPAPASVNRRPSSNNRPAGLLTLITVGIIVAVIVAIVVIKVTSSTPSISGVFQPTPAAIAEEITNVPASVFNEIGISSQYIEVASPTSVPDQPVLRWKLDGVLRPTIYYFGAEYCPYCAAERWPMIIALSRFGTFAHLGDMTSSPTDAYPSTPTFTLTRATYTSPYLNFFADEYLSNVPNSSGYTVLQPPTQREYNLIEKYDTSKYIPGLLTNDSYPFIDINNRYIVGGASFLPSSLAGATRDVIAKNLTIPSNAVTEGIITSANLLTATICKATAEQPSSVCSSSGVLAADTAMKIHI